MKRLALTFTILLGIIAVRAAEKPASSVVELPRPSSGTFTFAQAEARKPEILSNAPTPKLENWKNPYMGFSIHIGKDDELTVYGNFPGYRQPRGRQSVTDLKRLSDELPLLGNPAGILITSDLPLKDSKTIHEVLKALFVPSIQLFYSRSSDPDGAANGSQPVRPQANGTSSPAGAPR